MNINRLCVLVMGSVIASLVHGVEIKSFCKTGSLSFEGVLVGTTATVEWAASLTDPGRTNWQNFASLNVVTNVMTVDIPVYFRVRGASASNLPNGLMSHYTFDADEGGVVSDYGPIHAAGNVVGATWTASGVKGGAYSFDGTDDYIEIGPSSIYCSTGQLSVCAWCFIGNDVAILLSNYQGGSGYDGEFSFDYDGSCNLGVLFGQTGGDVLRYYSATNGLVSTQTWHHIAFSYDEARGGGFKIKIYLDGLEINGYQVQGEGNGGKILGITDKLRVMAHRAYYGNVYGKGMIDEVMIFNRALTAEEIRQIYDLSRPSPP